MQTNNTKIALRYRQIYLVLRNEILTGVYKPGEQFPTEYEIMSRFQASRTTVRSALKLLQEERLIASRRGSGTTVMQPNSNDKRPALSRLTDVHDIDFFFAIDPPWEQTVTEAAIDTFYAPQTVADALVIHAGSEVYRIQYLFSVNNIPFNYHVHYVRPDIMPGLETKEKSKLISLYRLADAEYGIKFTEAREDITPICASFIESCFLNVSEGTPLLRLCRTAHCSKGILEYCETTVNPKILKISLTLGYRSKPEM